MKVALVTGAAQGIGRRTAEVLAQRGFSLPSMIFAPPPKPQPKSEPSKLMQLKCWATSPTKPQSREWQIPY
jgi:hypothetical protein